MVVKLYTVKAEANKLNLKERNHIMSILKNVLLLWVLWPIVFFGSIFCGVTIYEKIKDGEIIFSNGILKDGSGYRNIPWGSNLSRIKNNFPGGEIKKDENKGDKAGNEKVILYHIFQMPVSEECGELIGEYGEYTYLLRDGRKTINFNLTDTVHIFEKTDSKPKRSYISQELSNVNVIYDDANLVYSTIMNQLNETYGKTPRIYQQKISDIIIKVYLWELSKGIIIAIYSTYPPNGILTVRYVKKEYYEKNNKPNSEKLLIDSGQYKRIDVEDVKL
jgi:hypothetical protein